MTALEHFSLPFKGRVGEGMGNNSAASDPIPLLASPLKGEELSNLTSPLKGEEPSKLALMGLRRNDDLAIAGAKVFVRLPCPICRSAMRQRQSVV